MERRTSRGPVSPLMPNAQEGMLCDEEAGAEGSGGHIAVVLLCTRFPMHGLIHKSLEKDGIDLGWEGPHFTGN